MSMFNLTEDVADLRDIVQVGREIFETWADDDADADDRQEAYEMLQELDRLNIELSLGGVGYAGALDALSEYAENEPTLIHEDYFQTYARELAEDIGAVQHDAAWPARHIDWEAAAEELKDDYSDVSFDGSTWYIRSV